MEYNDENLLALHAQGLSYTQIAMHFPGVTRCAVGGRLKRIRDAGAGVVPPRRDRDAGAPFIVGAGCEVPRDTPPDNLRALCAYAHTHQP